MKKNLLIPWSGGLDSTYLLYKALKDNHTVTTLSMNLRNNIGQQFLENEAREKIKIILSDMKLSILTRFLESDIDVKSYSNNFELVQPPIWVLFSALTLHEYIDEIQFGYVLGDHANSYIDDILNLFEAIKPFMKSKNAKITFPIIKQHKKDLYDRLPTEIKNAISYCENPIGEKYIACRKCDSCIKHILCLEPFELVNPREKSK